MQGTFDHYGIEHIELNSLADLDQLVSERFDIPLRPYSTDIRAALELVIWNFENSEDPYFAMFRSAEEAFPKTPFGVGFARKMWSYGKTAPLAICRDALYQLKYVHVTIAEND